MPVRKSTRWIARFPEGRQRSAVISALRIVQHDNNGYLTPELMDAVADYLDLPPIQVYEVASFYSMFETTPGGPSQHFGLYQSVLFAVRIG